jgi:TolB protein
VLRNGPADPGASAWSPDGRWLAFDAGPETRSRIYVVHPDGTGLRALVDGADPTWSRDGRTIAFKRGERSPGIWKMGVDGGAHRLSDGHSPAWSPDGRRIAFVKKPCDGCRDQLYVMAAGGAGAHRLTGGQTGDVTPSWSPDGELIAFGVCCYDGPQDALVPTIDVVRPDGGGRRTLHRADYADFANPAWSPDGRRTARRASSDSPRTAASSGRPTGGCSRTTPGARSGSTTRRRGTGAR